MLQGSLLDLGLAPELGTLETTTRRYLDGSAWVDVRPGWLTGAEHLLLDLRASVPWRSERRRMYDGVVDVPRLVAFYDEGELLPHPVLEEARARLSAHYAGELGEPFMTAGLCYYRDGQDSVAWHGDRIGRSRDIDTMIAILAVGADRPLALRPRDGGSSQRIASGHGDLVVMGGACQRTWEHAIPKVSGHVGPRISIQFRVRGVR